MKNKNSIKFNFNSEMSKYLIEFNELKKKTIKIKQNKELSEVDLIKLEEFEKKLNVLRFNFITEFRKQNKGPIKQYLENSKGEKVSEK